MARPVIVFAGAVYPGQFGALCDHLRRTGLAESWFITTPGHRERNLDNHPNLLAFKPDGPIVGKPQYHYTGKLERSARIGRGLLAALQEFQRQKPIDVVVCHSLWGAPHFLYDEVDAAIVSYIEFPSFRAHGWDPNYPPDQSQRMVDRNTEMLNLHQAVLSDLVICPSHHAKRMFPPALQGNIEVQLEGIDFGPPLSPEANRPFTIGFTARDLSNSKGFDVFVQIVDRLLSKGIKAEFVALGGSDGVTYGYEQQWVQRQFGGTVPNFAAYLMQKYPAVAQVLHMPGKLPYDGYVQQLSNIDLFLYPLRFGVANWGLIEILSRGGCVIAPNRGYPAELIHNGINGILLPDDIECWANTVLELQADPMRRAKLSESALKMGQAYRLDQVAPRYMALFQQAIENRRRRKGN